VIRIIRAEDHPKAVLMQSFNLSERQADAILDIRLRQLARLEEVKIRGEQDELQLERADLEKTINSKARLKTLIKKELTADAEEFGDERVSPLVSRGDAQAFSEKDLISTESVTIVLSEKGWIRAAKGHDIDPRELSYRAGDSFLQAVPGRSNQDVIFLDSVGRSYTQAAHTLPSARGQGEPLTGRVNPPSGAYFTGVLTGEKSEQWLVTSSAGYGFVTSLGDMSSKNKAGKSLVSVPAGAITLQPAKVLKPDEEFVAAFTSEGRLLIFPLAELPVLGRGKGVKIINIPPKVFKAGEESMFSIKVMSSADALVVHSGKRFIRLKFDDLEHYHGERARRGLKLPRGFQKVDSVELEKG